MIQNLYIDICIVHVYQQLTPKTINILTITINSVSTHFWILFVQQKLSEIRQWTEKVRQYDLNYITDNGLFYLDCSGVPGYLVPKLNEIYEELCSFVVDEALGLAKKFCTEMKETLEVKMYILTTD